MFIVKDELEDFIFKIYILLDYDQTRCWKERSHFTTVFGCKRSERTWMQHKVIGSILDQCIKIILKILLKIYNDFVVKLDFL